MSKHMRHLLRETHEFRRVVGFGDAVADLGTHRICGTDAPYSRQMVYNVLYGRSGSKKLLARIVERRPDLLDLSFVAETTKDAARQIGWVPGMGMPRRMLRGTEAASQDRVRGAEAANQEGRDA